ncbi:Transferrin receptor-like [Macleaya cordata]|uniref:glutamate carboxypeptidase II n=1 Tax=Macleaya cordata TaxID=56857 RepID=A0A200PRK1_MACCD|nr:Transferrin receptor-like [Macleaya cordata]
MAQPLSPNNSSIMVLSSSSSCTLVFVIFLCILGFYTLQNHPTSTKSSPHHQNLQKNSHHFQEIFLTLSSNYTVSTYLRELTLHPHIAGTQPSLQTVQYVHNHFKDFNLETHTVDFEALLSYPTQSSLSVHFRNGSSKDLSLTESGQLGRVVVPFHAYSPSGTAALAKVVFVNYGREEDYHALVALGVNVSGCVVVARRGEVLSRAGVVERAAANGAVAVLMYTEGDGDNTRFNGGVERGTVMRGLGDPLSPGWGGVGGGEKLGLEDSEVIKRFPKIPSMPISVENAEMILGSLEGARVPYEWRAALKSKVGRVGPGPTLVNFTYQEEKKVATIHNVFAVIRGWEEPDRYVLLGNHRDAWTYGAVDPNSGTAALLDIAHRYAHLMRLGWAPRRTIILCSWDAEEFGMVGSTEWVEQNLLNLGSKAVVYLNVDCAVQGPGFFARATPQLDNLIIEVTKKIKDPDSEGKEVYQTWVAGNRGIDIQRLSGVDSDYAPFLQHAGIPSIDLYYGKDFPVYHTAFDSFDWMTKYGDPLFHRHVAVAGIWGLLALHLADDPVLPFDYLSYAAKLQEHTNALDSLLGGGSSLHPITSAIQEFISAAKEVELEKKKLREQTTTDNLLILKKRSLNDRLMLAERGLLDPEGLLGRQWFKHLVYGPPKDDESKLVFFPGIADAITQATRIPRGGQSGIQHEIWRVARAIQRASTALKGELS